MNQPILGIDLGTTMSAAAIYADGDWTFVENDLGETLTPSVVAHDTRNDGIIVGRTAKELLASNPGQGAANFKRLMGEDSLQSIGVRKLSPIELSAYVLDSLHEAAERQFGTRITRCVVTVPAYFGEAQRHATRQAAEMAGFRVDRVLNEPTAAAMAYGLHNGEDETKFVVLDLGGGTFDVCVMELFEGLLEVRGVAGVSQLGGEDFTRALADLALDRAKVHREEVDRTASITLHKRAELLKRKLSRWSQATIRVPTDTSREVEITVSQADADSVYQPLLGRMLAPCRSALRGAGVTPADLDHVVLVGGATRMPCVAQLATEVFGLEPRRAEDPDHVVARGAALQGALTAQDASVRDIVVTDVASHSLGIDVCRGSEHHVAGYFSPIIERNTVLPTSRSETFCTIDDHQTHILIGVYEGEARKVANNRKLGEISVKGIPKGPPRAAIDVRFTYDINGILEVEATILETKRQFRRVFQRGAKTLTPKELEKAQDEIRRLKADPRERPRYRDLLARADALWTECRGMSREALSQAVDRFEQSLAQRNPGAMEKSYAALLEICEHIDQGERW